MENRMAQVESSLTRLETQVSHIDQRLTEVHSMLSKALHGNTLAPGLVVRTDRLEQWQKRSIWWFGTIVVAVLPLIGTKLLEWVR